LAFYVQSAGSVLNITVGEEQRNNPKAILHSILGQLVEFKRSDNNIGFDNASTPPLMGPEDSIRGRGLEF